MIHCKIIYCGPTSSGKTTSLQYIQSYKKNTDPITEIGGFDFLPLNLEDIGGFKSRFYYYTLPNSADYRKLLVKGLDGIVFVADLQKNRIQDNLDSLKELKKNLNEQGYALENIPMVFQCNKKDLGKVFSADELKKQLDVKTHSSVTSSATSGEGVYKTLEKINQLVISQLQG